MRVKSEVSYKIKSREEKEKWKALNRIGIKRRESELFY